MPRLSHTPGGAAVLEQYADHLGIPVWDPPHSDYPWWNGAVLRRPAKAEDWAHEIAHWLLATPERRRFVDYGWGQDADFAGYDHADPEAYGYVPPGHRPDLDGLPWPTSKDCPPTSEEIFACLLGFAFLVRVGEPAPYDLYGFLDYTWHPGDAPGSVVRRVAADTYAERRQVQPHVAAFNQWRASLPATPDEEPHRDCTRLRR